MQWLTELRGISAPLGYLSEGRLWARSGCRVHLADRLRRVNAQVSHTKDGDPQRRRRWNHFKVDQLTSLIQGLALIYLGVPP